MILNRISVFAHCKACGRLLTLGSFTALRRDRVPVLCSNCKREGRYR